MEQRLPGAEQVPEAPVAHPVHPAVMNDPVRNVRTLHRFEFVRHRPPAFAERALVFLTSGGRPQTYLPNQQPTRGELVSKNFRTLYEVEMGIQHLSFDHRLPSDGDAFFFSAETDLTWRVVDPTAVVEKRVRDVRALIEPRLLARMRQETRRFAIERSAAAEAAVMDALAAVPLAAAEGLEIHCQIRLSLDEEAVRQYSSLRSIDYARATTTSEHELTRLRTQNEQQLMDERTRFYAQMLAQGDVERWGLHLAENPRDIPLAIEGIRDDEREASANQVHIIEKLLDAGVLEDHMLEEPARVALESLKARLADAAQGRTRKQPLYREQLEVGHSRPDAEKDGDGQGEPG